NRIIFRSWPRDSKGKAIQPFSLWGKEAGNGLDLWGATLYDFYHVRRLPYLRNNITNSTGSKLAKWMRQAGELTATDELHWAEKEEISVADIGELIRYDSPFNPAYYTSPCRFIPCTHKISTLQQRIHWHLLPQKLHIHYPWHKLSVDKGGDDHKTPCLFKVADGGDIIRTYSLPLEPEGKEAVLKAQKRAQIAEDEAIKGESVLRIFPAEKEGPMEEPLIEVVLPPQPRKRTQVEEAHLYLSFREVDSGDHSVVHGVEWELPRDLFVKARICRTSVEEDVRRQVQKLKDKGE
ncbi:uncharacterized protein EDB91DRAFT_1057762, partial [Suillus paluster]|uniref:uncharacterized protein n=1 Tax=Suillus paluster TaxID=48578 RepID=UPI001B868155